MKALVRINISIIISLTAAVGFSAGSAPMPNICNRTCWGARASLGTTQMSYLNRAIVHHTQNAGDYSTTGLEDSKARMRFTQNYHMDVKGWSDIGYHFVVDKHGNIFEGRYGSMTTIPKGVHDGFSQNSFGFSCLGNFHPPSNNQPTSAMMNSLYNVIAWRMPSTGWQAYGTPGGSYGGEGTVGYIDTHRRVYFQICPGDLLHNTYCGNDIWSGTIRYEVNRRVQGTPAAQTYVLDNNSSAFSASSNWVLATSSTDKYGPDYRYRWTAAVSDAAVWTKNLPAEGFYDYSAWWTQGTNRSTTASYIVPGDVSVVKNQQTAGGQWNFLAKRWCYPGDNTVKLSCWTTTGYVVVADAVRVYGPYQ